MIQFFLIFALSLIPAFAHGESRSVVPLFTPEQWEGLPVISPEDYELLKSYDPITVQGLPREKIKSLSLPAAKNLYQRISDEGEGWGILRLFSDPFFQTKGQALFYSREVCLFIDSEYDLHPFFNNRGKTARPMQFEGKSVPAGTSFEIAGMIGGNGGVFWVLYPFPLALHTEEYKILSGNYDLFRINTFTGGRDEKGRYMIDRLRGRNHPQEEFQPLRAALNVGLKRYVLTEDQKQVSVYTLPFGRMTVPNYPINLRKPQFSTR